MTKKQIIESLEKMSRLNYKEEKLAFKLVSKLTFSEKALFTMGTENRFAGSILFTSVLQDLPSKKFSNNVKIFFISTCLKNLEKLEENAGFSGYHSS